MGRWARRLRLYPILSQLLGELGDEIQGFKDLEIAGDAAEEVGTGGVWEALRGVLLGEVKDLALLGDSGSSVAD